MDSSSHHVLSAIGNTPLVRLRKIVPPDCAQVLVKLESQNPTGSMKDRMALAVISRAEEDGRLDPRDPSKCTVIEYTGGSTGSSLALVCAAKGYPIRIVTSDAFSQEKRDHMAALGAQLTLISSDNGLSTKKLFYDMIEAAREMSRAPNTLWIDQLNNRDSIGGYFPLGEEIWNQTNGKVDAFVQCVGTGASLSGVATVLKRHNPKVKLIAVEPGESAVLSGGKPGAHKIEGIGIGFAPPLFDASMIDEIVPITTHDANEMARRLTKEEAIFAGTSSGANVLAAMQVAKRLSPDKTVVTLAIDSGMKYVSTELYRSQMNI